MQLKAKLEAAEKAMKAIKESADAPPHMPGEYLHDLMCEINDALAAYDLEAHEKAE